MTTLNLEPLPLRSVPLAPALEEIYQALLRGASLTPQQAATLWSHPNLLEVAALADWVATERHAGAVHLSRPLRLPLQATCPPGCAVCAALLSRGAGDGTAGSSQTHEGASSPEVYPVAALLAAAAAAPDLTEIHLVALEAELGWQHPSEQGAWPTALERYAHLVGALRAAYPGVWIQGFTPAQLAHMASASGQELEQVLAALQRAGLDGLLAPDEEVYTAQGPRVASRGDLGDDETAAVQALAHRAGLVAPLSLRYGPEPDGAAIISSLLALRARQQQTAGASVCCLVPDDVLLSSSLQQAPGGYEDLRVTALARLVLDNVPHVRVPWLALGLKMGQVALSFGADDLGWASLDPHVHAYAHPATFLAVSPQATARLITGSGRHLVGTDGAWRPLSTEGWTSPTMCTRATPAGTGTQPGSAEPAQADASCDAACS